VRQLCYLLKKIKGDCDDTYKFGAVSEFYTVEVETRIPDLDWDDVYSPHDHPGRGVNRFVDFQSTDVDSATPGNGEWASLSRALQRVSDVVVGLLPEFEPSSISCRHGPGAVSDGRRGQSKYSFPHWPQKLDAIFPYDWHASSNYCNDGEYPVYGKVWSQLMCVPKTMKGPRLIASEPISNQWVQQGLAAWFLRAFDTSFIGRSIRIRDQTHNQQMAKLSSNGSGATVDLSSASDRLSCLLVERVFRAKPELLSAMMACRTSNLVQRLDKKHPEAVRLKKFASMGSALTFPVQSLVFYIICVTAVLVDSGDEGLIKNIKRAGRKVAVYGDDLIVPVRSLPLLERLLTTLGLKVNKRKTYGTGMFRESCGADWYNGTDVRPCYIRSDFDPKSPSTVGTVVATSNNFHSLGMWRVADYLLSRIPLRMLDTLPINQLLTDGPAFGRDDARTTSGLLSFCGAKDSHLRRRYNRDLHRYEFKVASLQSKDTSGEPSGYDRLRQFFTEEPLPEVIWAPALIGRTIPSYRTSWKPTYQGGDRGFLPKYGRETKLSA
jgi:hypothetical protein